MPNCRPGDHAVIVGPPPGEGRATAPFIGMTVRVVESTPNPMRCYVEQLGAEATFYSFPDCAPYWAVEPINILTPIRLAYVARLSGFEAQGFVEVDRMIWPDRYLHPLRGDTLADERPTRRNTNAPTT